MASRWTRPGEHTEIVQIGAVKLDAETLKITDEFECLVRPRVNPVLSQYLTDLTGITNAMLDAKGGGLHHGVSGVSRFCRAGSDLGLWARRSHLRRQFEALRLGWASRAALLERDSLVRGARHRSQRQARLRCRRSCRVPCSRAASTTRSSDARGVASGIRAVVARGAPNPFARPESP